MSPVRLVGRVTRGATEAARHPVASGAFAVGLVRGVVRSVARVVSGGSNVESDEPAASEPGHVLREPGAGVEPPVAAAVPSSPPDPVTPDPVAHEPKAVSRDSEHGRADDAFVDDWEAEADETETVEPAPADPVDEGELKAIRTEAEMMRKAADPHPD